jgi:thiosulfate dehydrogenase [quinone] large subunit
MGRAAADTGAPASEPARARFVGAPLGAAAVRAWALLPLRLFLGLTFIDAGLGKLFSAAYFGSGPKSFTALAQGFAQGSPIGGPIRTVVLAHPYLFALLLAVAELAVGVCALIGLASRLAAGLGLALSVTFFLTASWRVRPFFYGADLPFAVGWLTLLLAGHGGLPSVDAMLLRRHRSEQGWVLRRWSPSPWTASSSNVRTSTSKAGAPRRPETPVLAVAASWPLPGPARRPQMLPGVRFWPPPARLARWWREPWCWPPAPHP